VANLNERLSFEHAELKVRRAFLRTPERIRLDPPTRLYRWTNPSSFDGSHIATWWSFVESTRLTSGKVADGFLVSEERAARIGRSHQKFARARVAISDQFGNTMAELLMVKVVQPVWGFAGQASGQREFADSDVEVRHVFLIGGAYQLWIPNLTLRHVIQIPFRV